MIHGTASDVVRTILIIIPAFAIYGMVPALTRVYLSYYRSRLKKVRTPQGLTGWGFMLFALSHLFFVGGVGLGSIWALGRHQPFSYRGVMVGIGLIISLMGMIALTLAQRKKSEFL